MLNEERAQSGDDERADLLGAVLDLLDVIAERGGRLGLDDDRCLDAVADDVSACLSAMLGRPGEVSAAREALDVVRGALQRLEPTDHVPGREPVAPLDPAMRGSTVRLLTELDAGPASQSAARRESVHLAVHAEAARFVEAPVRGYLPILVERRVRRALITPVS